MSIVARQAGGCAVRVVAVHQLRRTRVLLLAAIAVGTLPVWWTMVMAFSDATFSVEKVVGDGWVASEVAITVDLGVKPATARLRAKRMQFAVLGSRATRTFHDIDLECTHLDLHAMTIACNRARLRGVFPGVGRQVLSGSVRFDRRERGLAFALANLQAGGGTARVSGDWRDGGWSARMDLKNGRMAALHTLLKDWLPAASPLNATGELDLDLELRGIGSSMTRAQWRLRARQLTVNNVAGTVAGERLVLDSRGSLSSVSRARSAGAWSFVASLAASSGQAYAEPMFVDLRDHPLSLSVEGEWQTADRVVTLRKFTVAHDGAVSASGQVTVALADPLRVMRMHLDVHQAQLPGAYAVYLQPYLLNSAWGALATRGSLSGVVEVAEGAPTMLALDLREVSAEDARRRWSMNGLSGKLHWRKQRAHVPSAMSKLGWQRAQVFGIGVGAAAIEFTAADRDFAMARATSIPVLDGSVELASLRLEAAGLPDMMLQMDATLRPISVQGLCAAFGWPLFGGRIGGRLTDLQFRGGALTLGTVLRADVFDGQVNVADLRLEQLFSDAPRLSASIAIDRVDLEQLTSAFSFGTITGRLSGAIDELRLFNWSPVAFDASLHTSPGDRSRHRISQRAVKNLGSLGGGSGAAAALSGGLLRFFENFNYERLGIRCRLENEVCTMNGVEPAKNGYYLVKGSGLPRIDVIGSATRVDWPRLVAQLRAATESQGLRVESPAK